MYQEQLYSLTPQYVDGSSRQLGVLQQLQTLLNVHATLSDVAQLVQSFQQEFGVHEQLESVIQMLAGRCLEEQVAQHKSRLWCNSALKTAPAQISQKNTPRSDG